ncbi:MAG: DMT family transporter [Patescibacteria group bacterium]|nr:DMT family transporter [Patescibacteria group bacterium]
MQLSKKLGMGALGAATVLALMTAFISGTNTFLAKIAVKAMSDPIAFTTLKNAIVAALLIGLVLALKKHKEIASLSRRTWIKLFAIGIIGGCVPFAMFFIGLSKTSAVNAAFIHKTLFIWVALLAIPLLKEKMNSWQLGGILAIFGANLVIGGFKGFNYEMGELLIVGATVLWAVENIIAKVTLKDVSVLTVASARMVIGSVGLAAIVAFSGGFGGVVSGISAAAWGWTLLTSVLLLGYVLTWYSALKLAPVTFVATLLVPATLITNILSAIFITHSFNAQMVGSTILFVVGTVIFIGFAKKSADSIDTTSQVGIEA